MKGNLQVSVSQRCGLTTHFRVICASAVMVLIMSGQIAQAADGDLDPTFGTDGKVQTDFPDLAAVASSVVIQPDGKIVVAGGAFPLFTFAGDFKVVRYNSNGSLDSSFGDGGIVTTTFPEGSYAFDVALQADGKIIAAGTVFVDFNPGDSSNTDFALARYNPDGIQ